MRYSCLKSGYLVIAVAIISLSPSCRSREAPSTVSKAALDSYVEAELFRLAETYRILDRHAEELWPGWTSYADIPIKVNFPNGVVLAVGTLPQGRSGFEQVAGRTISGKPVLINTRKRTSVEVRPPLFAKRGRYVGFIDLDMEQPDLPPLETERSAALEERLKTNSRPDAPFDLAPYGDSDSEILMYIHEHFHGYQNLFPRSGPTWEALRDFRVDAEYAAWSHIEGLALRRAYLESRDDEALAFFKDFAVARRIKRARMPADAATVEARISTLEGTASYASLKTTLLLKDPGEKLGREPAKDPFFYGFAYADGYFDTIMRKGMDFAVAWSEDKQNKYYLYGAYQCFLLDRFTPGWKKGFLEGRKTLDAATEDSLKLTAKEEEEITKRLPSRYNFDEIIALHRKALARKKELIL